jgi:hypothetical protein
MVETLKLNGTGKLLIDEKTYDCFINIDLLESSINLYGDFDEMIDKEYKYSPNIFDFFKSKYISLKDVSLDSNYGKITGEINDFFVSSIKFKGSNFLSGSVVAQLFHIEPNNNYDQLRITPRFSKLSFILEKSEKVYTELWFKIPPKTMNFREDVSISDEKKMSFFSDNDIVIMKCWDTEIIDIEIDKIRSALSFIIGTEIIYIYGFRNGHIEINNRSTNIENKCGVFQSNFKGTALNAFLRYVYSIAQNDYERFENSLYLYLSAKSASLSMNSLFSLQFICIESMFDSSYGVPLETKLLKLFNLNNPKEYDQEKNTISFSMNSAECHVLSKIRNMIMHEGIAAEKIYNKVVSDPVFKTIAPKCYNNCIELWFYITSLLDKYFLNRIQYSGEYINVGNGFSIEKTIR